MENCAETRMRGFTDRQSVLVPSPYAYQRGVSLVEADTDGVTFRGAQGAGSRIWRISPNLEPDAKARRTAPRRSFFEGQNPRIPHFLVDSRGTLQHSRGRCMIDKRPWSLANKWLESRNTPTIYVCLETQ
jgi:hypothetical protein